MSYKTFDNVEDTFDNGPGAVKPGVATFFEDKDGPYAVFLTARCRKCEKCLRRKAIEWANRARAEISVSRRTWFGTLTLTPAWHEHFANLARRRCARRKSGQFETLSPARQLQERHLAIQGEITKALKRLREKGSVFRYILVLEAHKSGLPHYHILVHEVSAPIPYRVLSEEWKYGFSTWKLVDDPAAGGWYVAKYISKSQAARVRASLHYGSLSRKHLPSTLNNEVSREGVQGGAVGTPLLVCKNEPSEKGATDLKERTGKYQDETFNCPNRSGVENG